MGATFYESSKGMQQITLVLLNYNQLAPHGHLNTWFMLQKVCSSGELVIMGINPEKPHYVVGVISCKLSSANHHGWGLKKYMNIKLVAFQCSKENITVISGCNNS